MSRHAAGLAVGKFYPPHAGHHLLLDAMTAECSRAYVAVCHSSVETIPVEDRIAWLKDRHPSAIFFPVYDDSPVLYTDETWELFLSALIRGLVRVMRAHGLSSHFILPTMIYSGEDYAPEFATRLRQALDDKLSLIGKAPEIGVRMIDRKALNLSATQFRSNPAAWWGILSPATRAGLCRRVVICGAESSGTTTLAKDLADLYMTPVVPEYGRHFDWAVGKHHEWKSEDFYYISREQKRWEDNLARESRGGLLICDTDEFATAMFHEVYLNEAAPRIVEAASKTPADLYIITSHEGIDFEDDGTRFNSGRRPWMTEWFRRTLPGNVKMVEGSRWERVGAALPWIDDLLRWDIADPIEKRPGYEFEGLVQA